jgi:Restriction endonuclease
MAAANKTIGPLHLEDLEPHRFEDLVRQLLYDFRPWRDLEATGRSGSDEGFDVRAWESTVPVADSDTAEEQNDDAEDTATVRQWLIQCKREKTIPPSKLKGYLAELPDVQSEGLYGIIFVAACDFSKAARDVFYGETRERGFMEVKLWGKAELEDQLFQPKNDHLLFAYFGISLQVRQRTLKTTVRARLSTKRQAKKTLTLLTPVLIRDASDERYPYPDPDKSLKLIERRRWRVIECEGCHHDGVWFSVFRAPAYIADDGESWDYAEGTGQLFLHSFQDPWRTAESENDEEVKRPIHAKAMEK